MCFEPWSEFLAHERAVNQKVDMILVAVVLYRIVGIIYEGLASGVVISKRYCDLRMLSALNADVECTYTPWWSRYIYYQDPALFKTQRVVDRYVDILAYTFEVPRTALNVVGAPNGNRQPISPPSSNAEKDCCSQRTRRR